MASAEIVEFLSKCPTPESGCFASDPDALDRMLNFSGDSGIRTDLQRAASAATAAAEEGIPLEEATYEPVKIEVAGIVPGSFSTGPHGERRPHEYHKLGRGESRRIIEEVSDGDKISKLRERIARCGYACGATAVGCPLRTPPAEA